MAENQILGLLSLALLILYAVVKDIAVPLLRRRNARNAHDRNPNPVGESLAELKADLRGFREKEDVRWEEQQKKNERYEKHFGQIFARLDAGSRDGESAA